MWRAGFRVRALVALTFLVVMGPASSARAQRFGGGSTFPGDVLRGEGAFAWGAGVYNLYTAQAESIHVNTAIRLNEYLAAALKQENRENAEYRAFVRAKHEANYKLIQQRLKESPEEKDVMKGDALNMLRIQLLEPSNESSVRVSQVPLTLPGDTVRRIPFFFAQEKATISFQRMQGKGKWPVGLRDAKFDVERRAYDRALDHCLDLLNEGKGKLSLPAVEALDRAVKDLLAKLDREVPPYGGAGLKVYLDSKNFLMALDASARLFKSYKVEQIMCEIDKYSGTTVYDLLQFMQRNNLSFGAAAEIGDERELFPRLYAAMVEQRDQAIRQPMK